MNIWDAVAPLEQSEGGKGRGHLDSADKAINPSRSAVGAIQSRFCVLSTLGLQLITKLTLPRLREMLYKHSGNGEPTFPATDPVQSLRRLLTLSLKCLGNSVAQFCRHPGERRMIC